MEYYLDEINDKKYVKSTVELLANIDEKNVYEISKQINHSIFLRLYKKILTKLFTVRKYDKIIFKALSLILTDTELIHIMDYINKLFTEIVIVEKDIVDNKEDRIRRIVNKYSIKKVNMDKSPPINEEAQSKIMSARLLVF